MARLIPPPDAGIPTFLLSDGKVAERFHMFKTTSIFNSTAEHPEWLGEEPSRVKELVLA